VGTDDMDGDATNETVGMYVWEAGKCWCEDD
jgi:hypothetical protein